MDFESDKLEVKVPYDGEIGQYRQDLYAAIDRLESAQDEMETLAFYLLIQQYEHSRFESEGGFEWADKQTTTELRDFLYGDEPELDELAEIIGEMGGQTMLHRELKDEG
jgi:hypothetical protein